MKNLLIGPVRNKCLLSAQTGVLIKRVEFRENVGGFPNDTAPLVPYLYKGNNLKKIH